MVSVDRCYAFGNERDLPDMLFSSAPRGFCVSTTFFTLSQTFRVQTRIPVLQLSLWSDRLDRSQLFSPASNFMLNQSHVSFSQASADAETIYDVMSSRFGEDITKWYIDPFVRGVFAADCKQLSFKAAFPGFWYMMKNKKVS